MSDQGKPPNPNDPSSVSIVMDAAQFKRHLVQSLASPTAAPMFVIWYDTQSQWCFSVANEMKNVKNVRKNVATIMLKVAGDLKLFDEVMTSKGN